MIKVTAKSYNQTVLQFFIKYLSSVLKLKNYKVVGLPSKTKKITLLRSPHVYKKAKVQYQQTKYSSVFYIDNNDINYVISRFNTNTFHGINLKIEYCN